MHFNFVALGENTCLQKKTGIFLGKIVKIRMLLYYKNKVTGDIFEEKGINEHFC